MRLAVFILLLSTVPTLAQPTVSGRWSGQWVTETNGHHGPLRANATPANDGYDVRFSGRFAKIVPFTYRQHLTQIGTDGTAVYLTADRRLPLFGTFHMSAIVTGTRFDARFNAGKESGWFILQR